MKLHDRVFLLLGGTGGIGKALVESVWPLVEKGTVRPVMDQTMPLAEASAAHARMESGTLIGKIVLKP